MPGNQFRLFGPHMAHGNVGLARLHRLFEGYAEQIKDGEESMRALFVLMAESLGPLREKVDKARIDSLQVR